MRLIDANELQQIFNETSTALMREPKLLKDIEHMVRAFLMTTEMIKDAPTIEAEPVKHGEWVEKNPCRMKWIPEESDDITEDEIEVEDMTEQKCSICQRWTIKFTHHIELNFCPLCGARMDGDTNG